MSHSRSEQRCSKEQCLPRAEGAGLGRRQGPCPGGASEGPEEREVVLREVKATEETVPSLCSCLSSCLGLPALAKRGEPKMPGPPV